MIVLVLAITVGLLLGGSLRGFEAARLHWWGLAVAGLVLQLIRFPALPLLSVRGSAAVGLLLSYLLILAALALNRRVPAAPVMGLGLLLNLAVVGVNAGMPVSSDAIRLAGGDPGSLAEAETAKHHLMTEDDSLTVLGDVIPLPPPIGVVLSIGDVLLYGGMAWFVVQIMRGRNRVNPRPLAIWFLAYRGKHAPDHWRLASRNRESHAAEGQSGTER